MFEYTCTVCDCNYTTEIPMDDDVRKICFPCVMDELEADEITCDHCEGTGKNELDITCSNCSGTGWVYA
jgi:RecJ-like exonuclease